MAAVDRVHNWCDKIRTEIYGGAPCGCATHAKNPPVPLGRALTQQELERANSARVGAPFVPSPGRKDIVIREPNIVEDDDDDRKHDKEPRFKLLRRVDGLYVVRDVMQWPPAGPVFFTESDAREWMELASEGLVGEPERRAAE